MDNDPAERWIKIAAVLAGVVVLALNLRACLG
jgi:hypothetical protein